MRSCIIAIIFIITLLPASGLGDVTGDYSDNLSELRSIQDRWNDLEAGTNLSQGTKDAVGEQISTLIRWLELGEDAGKLGISDKSIKDAAAQLASLAFALSVNSLLTGIEALQVESDLSSVARHLFDKAETADLLSQPVAAKDTNLLSELDYWRRVIFESDDDCAVMLSVNRSNPSSAIRFAEFDVSVLAAPGGGTFTWAWVREIDNDGKLDTPPEIEDFVIFGTSIQTPPLSKILKNASLDGEVLPIQEIADESGLVVNRQIIKGAGLASPLSKLERGSRSLHIVVRYDTPDGARCRDSYSIRLDPALNAPMRDAVSETVEDLLIEEKFWE